MAKDSTKTYLMLTLMGAFALVSIIYLIQERDIFDFDLHFEPGKGEVCMEWEVCSNHTYFDQSIFSKGYVTEEVCFYKTINPDKILRNTWLGDCTGWRPKNVCDTDPNNGACVCDEYTDDTKVWVLFNKNKAREFNISNEELVNISYAYLFNYSIKCPPNIEDCFINIPIKEYNYNSVCTKAHLRGE